MSETTATSETIPVPTSIRGIVFRRGMLAIVLLSVVSFGLVYPFPFDGRLSGDLFDLAHAPVFCFALICLIGFCDPAAVGLSGRFVTVLRMSIGRVAIITGVVMFVGLIGEYLQQFAARNPSWADVAANTVGLVAGLVWIASRTVTGARRRALVAATVGLLILVSVNPLREVWDCIQQIRSFPVLASFERPRELGSWAAYRSQIERSNEWSTDGKCSLRVNLTRDDFPGVAMVWFDYDWSSYTDLQMDLRNSNAQPLSVVIKLFDEQHTLTGYDHHDRFHREVELPSGAAVAVKIDLADVEAAPATRRMNMRRIWAIEIFSPDVAEPRVLFVDHVRLTNQRRVSTKIAVLFNRVGTAPRSFCSAGSTTIPVPPETRRYVQGIS